MKLNIIEIFEDSYQFIIKNIAKLSPLIITVIGLQLLGTYLNSNIKLFSAPMPSFFLIFLILLPVGSLINYALNKTILKIPHRATLSLQEAIRFLVIAILYVLLTIGGFILFIIPGIYFSSKYFFVNILLIDKGLSVKEAWSQAPKLTSGRKLKLLPFLLIDMMLGGLLSVLLTKTTSPYLSSFITSLWSILYMVVHIKLYQKFKL